MKQLAGVRSAVIDASAVVDFLLQPASDAPLARLFVLYDVELHAPALFEVEAVAGVRRALLRGQVVDIDAARSLVQDLVDLPVELYPHHALLSRMLDLRANFTTYDATYVALAETLDVPLLTGDARLAAATRTHTEVDVIEATI
jgi:predicted nucleic acid-binding protein